jgi:hypothetical protein
MHWNPQSIGEYKLLLFSAAPSDLAADEAVTPTAAIPILVS